MVKLSGGRRLRRWISVGAILAAVATALPVGSAVFSGSLAVADAAPCPPVEVVFARGRTEPAGVGTLGNAFVNALRSRVDKTIGVYAVKYPADTEVDIGANDMSSHIQYMMNNCPDTRLVIGGYSLGAAVADVVLAVPFTGFGFKTPLPAGADGHIAAVALFGNGAAWVGPISNFSPIYADRTIELCHGADPICNPADPNTWKNNWPDHLAGAYIEGGMVNQAADFVAGRL
ncbi:cutinase [Mycobacterium sp. NS-7484]|nr:MULTISPECIES: cutinase family protein [unclassified Mycobacterium]OBG81109.1 cutinase [Mycobacterium sp. E802]OMB94279.1 cutinase [Mycobacterium sp. NS-7484]